MITIQKSQLSVMNIQYRYFSLDKFLDDAVGNEVSNIELWGAMPFPMALAGERPADYLQALGERLVHVHFIDGAPRGHLAWGDGILDMQEYLEEFSRYHYKGYLSLAITDGRYYMDPTQSVQQSVNALYKVLK